LSCYLPPLIYFCVPCSRLVPMRGDDLVVVNGAECREHRRDELGVAVFLFPQGQRGWNRKTGADEVDRQGLDGTATLTCANRLSAPRRGK
jgi:hypothetical protein